MNTTQLTYEQWIEQTGITKDEIDDSIEACWDCSYSSGHFDCNFCDGDGEIYCEDCDGEGFKISYADNDEQIKIPCKKCNETGLIECEDCDGEGEIECETCDGTGEINNTKEEYNRQFQLDKQYIKKLKGLNK